MEEVEAFNSRNRDRQLVGQGCLDHLVGVHLMGRSFKHDVNFNVETVG